MIHLNTYEELLQDADDEQVHVHESVDLNGDSTGEKRLNGLYVDGHIALDSQLKTTAEKTSILAEEMGHHFTSVGDITDLKNVNSRQQELDARLWGYNRLIGLRGIIRAFEHHCQNRYEPSRQHSYMSLLHPLSLVRRCGNPLSASEPLACRASLYSLRRGR